MSTTEMPQDEDRRDAEGAAGLGPSSLQEATDEKPTVVLVIGENCCADECIPGQKNQPL
jgi:hypothetical protein